VLPRALRLLRRIRETARDIAGRDPDVIVTIDAPSFAIRVLRRLASRRAPRLHYVAPHLWAWRPGRIRAYRRVFDRLLALLPFEPGYFEPRGLACSFVGHPAATPARGDAAGFRARHGLTNQAPLLLLLPGSRAGEISRMLPVFARAATALGATHSGLEVALLAAPGHEARLRARTSAWAVPPPVVETGERNDLFAAATVALAASGTVSIELAAAGLPHVVAYRLNRMTGWLARALIRVPYVNLINIVLERPVVPELLQDRCTPELLAAACARLVADPAAAAQREAFAAAVRLLAPEGRPPFERAAEAVLEALAGAADQPRRSIGR
jgi:lipid-A-disaccharide synthase